jgi:transcriptional regulator with XRE-family HTH domain
MDNFLSAYSVIHNGVSARQSKPQIDWVAFSQYIEKKLKDLRISRRELSKRAGLSHGTINNIFNAQNKRDFGTDTLLAIAHGLKVDDSELLDIAYGKPKDKSKYKNSPFASMAFKYENMPKTSKKKVEIETLMKILDEKLDEAQNE